MARKPTSINRKALSRAEREARIQRWILLATAGVVALVILILAGGFFYERVIWPDQPVASVDGQPIRTREFQKRFRFAEDSLRRQVAILEQEIAALDPNDPTQATIASLYRQQINQINLQLDDPTLLGRAVLQQLIDERLIRAEAERRGIRIPAEAIDREIERRFGFIRETPTPAGSPTPTATPGPGTPEPTPFPTPTPMSEASFRALYAAQLKRWEGELGFTETDYRAMIEAELLEQQLREAFAREVPTHEEQVDVRMITAETPDLASELYRRVQAEGFEKVFADVQAGKVVSATALNMGWTPVGGLGSLYGAELEKIVFATPVLSTTSVITSPVGYHIVFVAGREDRELSSYYLQARQQQAFEDWLQKQRTDPNRVRYFDWQNRLPRTTPARPAPR
ncbi:Chaperone SurA [Candidatus Thermoflexus japonica]|uniref:Chaperone SurA n=1 Tax=Candidatus Thermoflexus japonica TaxID=2035417 RepID=A0A2H5Y3Q3_9CHLR|nr:Chaperone SurA [Candidatus Thermoflexus japonica]